MTRLARAIVMRLLGGVTHGRIELVEAGRPVLLGIDAAGTGLQVRLVIRSPGVWRRLLRGSIGLAESYMDGEWECDDLVALTRIFALEIPRADRVRRLLAPVIRPYQLLAGLLGNTRTASRRQISAHYDLGNDLFELMLDPSMMYSCGVFESSETTLHDASLAKLDRVCERLDLRSADHLLEIGTGWGGMAIHAASRYGCRVTTTTISREQHEYALARVRAAGLDRLVTVLLQDYRELEGSYDKLVSIEMIEAVGWRNLGTFFRRCSELLRPDGVMLLQAITIDDRAYDLEKATRSFITKYIFPGGALPSLEVISRLTARRTDMRLAGMEDLTSGYPRTLRAWRENVRAHAHRLEALGYDERFRRMWELYLAYCEGGFVERRICDVQLLLAKPGFRAEPLAAMEAVEPEGARLVA